MRINETNLPMERSLRNACCKVHRKPSEDRRQIKQRNAVSEGAMILTKHEEPVSVMLKALGVEGVRDLERLLRWAEWSKSQSIIDSSRYWRS